MTRKPCWAVVLLGLSGCVMSSGFNRDMLEAQLHEEVALITDEDIKEIQTLTAQLRFPCRIAVALQGDAGGCHWAPADRKTMEVWAEALRKEGIASDVVFMSKMFLRGDTLKALRASAAKYGADALLVIKGTSVTESRMNPMALFNLTVVGGFVVPGSHRNALFLMEGGLIDVNNGFLYASMEAEGEGSTLAPTFIIEEKDAVVRAKQSALTSFGTELLLRLRNLRATSLPVNPPTVSGGNKAPEGNLLSGGPAHP